VGVRFLHLASRGSTSLPPCQLRHYSQLTLFGIIVTHLTFTNFSLINSLPFVSTFNEKLSCSGSENKPLISMFRGSYSSFEPFVEIHGLAALDFKAVVQQPFDCIVIQNCQAMQSIGRLVYWTVKDNMDNGLFIFPTLTSRRRPGPYPIPIYIRKSGNVRHRCRGG